jgi:hypothetical protein
MHAQLPRDAPGASQRMENGWKTNADGLIQRTSLWPDADGC